MKALLACFVLSCLALCGGSRPAHGQQPENNPQLQSIFRQGMEAMNAGHPEQAEKFFRQATETDPGFAAGYLDLGLAQIRQGKLTEATTSLEKALQLDPQAPGANMFLGIAYYQMNRPTESIEHLQQEIQANSNSAEAQMWLGIVELSAGHPEKATGPLDRAAELSPKDQNILDYRGRAHMQVAKASYARMYQLDPTSWRVHRLSAQIADEADHQKQAIDEYLAAIKLAPRQADLYEELGDEYRKTGATDLAEKAYAQQLELTPGNPIAMYNLGSVRVDRGEEKTGVPLLEQVVRIYGEPTVADYYLGRGLGTEGRNDEAAAELLRATKVSGEVQRRAWYELGQLYRKMGKTEEARAALAKYQALRQAADRESAKREEDWRRLNASSESLP
jgi:tetratricopeptide (TPR) repeat protein